MPTWLEMSNELVLRPVAACDEETARLGFHDRRRRLDEAPPVCGFARQRDGVVGALVQQEIKRTHMCRRKHRVQQVRHREDGGVHVALLGQALRQLDGWLRVVHANDVLKPSLELV